MTFRCPNCGFTSRETRYGDWIKDKAGYEAFWEDKPINVKLAIEDYFSLNARDPKKYILNFTADHNEVEWPNVKRV
ncbi:unnamed protein product, partial [marine sediment metagenome]